MSGFRAIAAVFAMLLLAGCAGLGTVREPPSVFVQSFRAVPNGSGAGLPAFETVLRVLNPNPEPLRLDGVVYTVRLDGRRLVQGVANQLPVIEGYGEGEVTLRAAVDVLGGVRLLVDLMNEPRERFGYALDVRLDPAGFRRDIRIEHRGEIELRPRTVR